MGPVLVLATIQVAAAILTEATLSFLGVGVPPTSPSLGTLIRIGNDFLFSGEWWITIFPGLMLVLIALSVNLLGDWLRDALNPTTALSRRTAAAKSRTCASSSPRAAARCWRWTTSPSTSRRARSWAWSANPAPASRSPARPSSACWSRPGRIAGGEILLAGQRIDNLPLRADARASAAGRSAPSSRTR